MSITSMDMLYTSLEKICPDELAKLQSSDIKEKNKALNAIAKKILLTEKSGQVEFTAKPKLWAILHFFRKLVGYSTKEHTHLEAALNTTRQIFANPTDQNSKYDAMRQILNVVIANTNSGLPILPNGADLPSHNRSITVDPPKSPKAVEDLGNTILKQNSPPRAPSPPPAETTKTPEPVSQKQEIINDYKANLKPHEQENNIRIRPQQLEACFANLESQTDAALVPKLEKDIARLVTAYEAQLTSAYDRNKVDEQKENTRLIQARRAFQDDSEDDTEQVTKVQEPAKKSHLATAATIEFADLKNEAMEILKIDLPQSLDEAQKLLQGGLKALVAKKDAAFTTFFSKVTARREERVKIQQQAANAYEKLVQEQIDPKMGSLNKTVSEAKQAFERDIRALKSDFDKTTNDLQEARTARLTSNLPADAIKKLEVKFDSLQKQIDSLILEQKAFTDVTSKVIAALQDGIRGATPNNNNWKESLEALRDMIQNIAPESGKPISDRIPEILQKSKDTLVMLRQNDLKAQYQKELLAFPSLTVSEPILVKAKIFLFKEKDILSQLTSSANGKFIPTLVHTVQQKFPLVAKNFPNTIHSFGDLRTAIQNARKELEHADPDTFVAMTNELVSCFEYIIHQALPTLNTLAGIEQLETQNIALTASTNDPLVTHLLMRQRDFLAIPNATTLSELDTFLEQVDEIQTHKEILKQLTQFIEDPDEHAPEKTLTEIKALLDTRKADFTPKLILACCGTINSRTGKAATIASKLPTLRPMQDRQIKQQTESTSDDEWN